MTFDPKEYYASYPSKIIGRPGYPARAAYKSAFLFRHFGKTMFRDLNEIKHYADIGGCFGFGANAMAYHIARRQGFMPETTVYEISPDFARIGKSLFPHIHFVEGEFNQDSQPGVTFDLLTLFDVVEHVVDPLLLLRNVAAKSRCVLLLTPMETSGEWRGNKQPKVQGDEHEDGHINFFYPAAYETLLREAGLELLGTKLIRDIAPLGARGILYPEGTTIPLIPLLKNPKRLFRVSLRGMPGIPYSWKRKVLGGGFHAGLCRTAPA